MTRTSTAKIEFRRWKAHTCVGCGGQYAYLLIRKLAYGGSTPERATEKAQAAADRAMVRDIDRQPCPTCGLYQPDMIAGRRKLLHGWLFLAALLALGLVAGLYLGDTLQANEALLVAMLEVTVVGGVGFLVDHRNPNRNREANHCRAMQEVAAGRIRVLRPGTPLTPGRERPAARWYGRLALVLAVAAGLALAFPELMRQQSAWPLNADCYPPVVGPGDTTCVYLPNWISSLQGRWAGASRVTAQVASAPRTGEFALESSTRQGDWGAVQARPGQRAVADRLWVRVKLPPNEKYAGKILACKIVLTVRYPLADTVDIATEQFQQEATLELAAPLAGRTYQTWWWGGFAGGAVLLTGSILVRLTAAAALRWTANPAEILDVLPGE